MKKIQIIIVLMAVLVGQATAQTAFFTSDSPRCLGDTMHFTPSAPGGNIVMETWNFGDGTIINYYPPTVFPVYSTHLYASAGTYTVTRTVYFDNSTLAHSLQINVLTNPTADFSWPLIPCSGQPVQFSDLSQTNAGFINQWIWDFGDGTLPLVINFPSSPNVMHTFSGIALSHIVRLTIKTNDGCTAFIDKTVTSVPSPVAGFAIAGSTCLSQPVQFVDISNPNSGSPISSWQWNFGDPSSGASNTSTLQNPLHLFSLPGLYSITLTVTNTNGCTALRAANLMINIPPVASFTASGACASQSTQFISTSIPNASSVISYSWFFGDGGSSSFPSPTHVYVSPGIYSVTLTIINSNGCMHSVTNPVTIQQGPVAAFSFTPNACRWAPIAFTDHSFIPSGAPGSINQWVWDFQDGTPPLMIVFPNNPDIVHTFNDSALTHNVRLTATMTNGCTSQAEHMVTNVSHPIAAFTHTGSYCASGPVHFVDMSQQNGGGPVVSWLWDFGDPSSGPNNTSTMQNPSHTFAGPGTYTVTLTVNNSYGCSDSADSTMAITPLPFADFSFTSNDCVADTVFFTDLSTYPSGYTGQIVQWIWNFGDGTPPDTIFFPDNPDIMHLYLSDSLTFSVRLKVIASTGCSDSVEYTLSFVPNPQAAFTVIGPSCKSQPVRFIDLSQSNGGGIINSWYWNFGDPSSGSGNISTVQNPTHIFAATGTYSVTLIVVTNHGCSDTVVSWVSSNPLPVAAFSAAQNTCLGSPVAFTDLSYVPSGFPASISQWIWSFGDGTPSLTITAPGNPNVSHSYSGPGLIYTVKLKIMTTAGCSDSAEHVVMCVPNPVAGFTGPGGTCAMMPSYFIDLSQTNGGSPIQSWNWNFGDPPTGAGNNSTAQNPYHSFSTYGMFTVTLIITNNNGCRDTTYQLITAHPQPFANFSADTVLQGSPSTFTNLSSAAGQGSIVNNYWEFGDGQTSTLANPTHAYAFPGIFQAKLTITDEYGCMKDTIIPVLVQVNPYAGIPSVATVTNATVSGWEVTCYNAVQHIEVAGNGAFFDVLPGGSATFICAQKIVFNPGTRVYSMGYLHAFIAPVGPFCPNPSIPAVIMEDPYLTMNSEVKDTISHFQEKTIAEQGMAEKKVKVYPNPTTGSFVLSIDGRSGAVLVDLYDGKGTMIESRSIAGPSKTEWFLNTLQAGIYLVRVTCGEWSETIRIVKL